MKKAINLSKEEFVEECVKKQQRNATRKMKSAFIDLLIGIGVVVFAFILFKQTLIEVYVLGHIAWALGGYLLLRGIENLTRGIKNK